MLPLAVSILQVVSIWSIASQTQSSSTVARSGNLDLDRGALELYQKAAKQLESEDPQQAIEPLEQIIDTYSSFELAPLAALRLAECYLAKGQDLDALVLLLAWYPPLAGANEQSYLRRSDPNCCSRAVELTQIALDHLTADQSVSIEKLLETQNFVGNEVCYVIVAELARRYAATGEYSRARNLLLKLGSHVSLRLQELRDIELPIAILLRESPQKPTTQEQLQGFIESLQLDGSSAGPLSTSQRYSLQMAIAEAWSRLGNWAAGLHELEQLANGLNATGTDEPIDDRIEQWRATVDLRRAELLLLSKQPDAALELATASLQRFPRFTLRNKLQIVQARCLIADLQFDNAIDLLLPLTQINEAENPISQPDAASRLTECAHAFWLLGEIEFFKKKYESALTYYEAVVQVEPETPWHPRALVEAAKCYELMGKPLAAVSAYRRILQDWPQSDCVPQANARLQALDSWQKRSSAAITKSTVVNDSATKLLQR